MGTLVALPAQEECSVGTGAETETLTTAYHSSLAVGEEQRIDWELLEAGQLRVLELERELCEAKETAQNDMVKALTRERLFLH